MYYNNYKDLCNLYGGGPEGSPEGSPEVTRGRSSINTRGRSSIDARLDSQMRDRRSTSPMMRNRSTSLMTGNRSASPMMDNSSTLPSWFNYSEQFLIRSQMFQMENVKKNHVFEQDKYIEWMMRLPLHQKNDTNFKRHRKLMLDAQKLTIDALTANFELQKMFLIPAENFKGLSNMSDVLSNTRERSLSPIPGSRSKSPIPGPSSKSPMSMLYRKRETVLNGLSSFPVTRINMDTLNTWFTDLQSRNDINLEETQNAFYNMYRAMTPNMPFLTNFSFMFPELINNKDALDGNLDDRMSVTLSGSLKTYINSLQSTGIKIMVASIINNFRSSEPSTSNFKNIDKYILTMASWNFIKIRAEFIGIHTFPYDASMDKNTIISQRAKKDCDLHMSATYGNRARGLDMKIKELNKQFYETEESFRKEFLEEATTRHSKILEDNLVTAAASSSR